MYIIGYTSRIILGVEAFQAKVVEKRNARILRSVYFFKSCSLWDNVKKHDRDRQATDDNITRSITKARIQKHTQNI